MNLRDIDMPISNIKEYIQLYLQGDKTIDERRDLMCRYTEYIKKKIENTINNLEMAIRKLKQYDSAVADILMIKIYLSLIKNNISKFWPKFH